MTNESNNTDQPFGGFKNPRQNWSRLPHQLIGALPVFDSKSELCVVLYVLRHTWGYSDDKKRITLDEFENGRKRKNGTRIDSGIGMHRQAIIDGLKRASAHGFILVETDTQDKGRVKKYYCLNTVMPGVTFTSQRYENHTPEVRKSHPRSVKTTLRSEKETSERNHRKKKDSAPATQDAGSRPSKPEKKSSSKKGSGRQPDPLFDAVAEQFFLAKPEDKSAVAAVAGRAARLVAFLKGRAAANPDGINRFTGWYARVHSDLTLPKDAAKFATAWLEFEASPDAAPVALPVPVPPDVPSLAPIAIASRNPEWIQGVMNSAAAAGENPIDAAFTAMLELKNGKKVTE